MTQPQNHQLLDVSGHQCPIPVLRLRRLLENVAKGVSIKLIASDPMTLIDIPNFCREAGHVIEKTQENEEKILYIIKKC